MKTLQMVKGKKNLKGKTVEIYGREWFDKVNGNSYHAAYVTIYSPKNEKEAHLVQGFTYGYGDSYIQSGIALLVKYGYLKETESKRAKYAPYFQLLRDNNVILLTSKQENCLKKQLATETTGE